MANEVSDDALTGELAGLIDSLRMSGYGQAVSGIPKALEGSADTFVDLLARHLLHEEQVLFPALREAAQDREEGLAALVEEHRDLRHRALELAELVSAGNRDGACAAGREFLATLFGHVHRETEATRRITEGLSAVAALRFKTRIEHHESEDA